MNAYVGTSGFSYKAWKGTFYPKGISEAEMLRFYDQHFRAVEINNTFYHMPKMATLESWADKVAPDFRFVLKAPQRITHLQRLRNADDSLAFFLASAEILKRRLGAVLFQLPPNMKKDLSVLGDFLALLPVQLFAAFEFRHISWFGEDVFALLHDHNTALCITDAENGLDFPFVVTADWGYLRMRRPNYGEAELRASVARIERQDWRHVFVFFKHEEAGKGPQFAKRFLDAVSGTGKTR